VAIGNEPSPLAPGVSHYGMGYVPFLRCNPGFRIPQPVEITENRGSVFLKEAARSLESKTIEAPMLEAECRYFFGWLYSIYPVHAPFLLGTYSPATDRP
jgi:hypothetical protein